MPFFIYLLIKSSAILRAAGHGHGLPEIGGGADS